MSFKKAKSHMEWKTTSVVLHGTNLILNRITAVRGALHIEPELFHTHRDENVSKIRKTDVIYGRKAFESPGYDWPCEAVSIKLLPEGRDLCLDLEERQSVTVETVLHANQEGDCRRLCRQELAGLTEEKLTELRRAHETWWRGFWEESSISVPEEPLAERYRVVLGRMRRMTGESASTCTTMSGGRIS